MSRFFCVPLGYGCTKKVAAARKMMRELDGDKTVQYTGDDFSCFDNARLAKVLQSHQNEAPSSYVKQKEAFDEQIRQLEREAYREYALGLRGMA